MAAMLKCGFGRHNCWRFAQSTSKINDGANSKAENLP